MGIVYIKRNRDWADPQHGMKAFAKQSEAGDPLSNRHYPWPAIALLLTAALAADLIKDASCQPPPTLFQTLQYNSICLRMANCYTRIFDAG